MTRGAHVFLYVTEPIPVLPTCTPGGVHFPDCMGKSGSGALSIPLYPRPRLPLSLIMHFAPE